MMDFQTKRGEVMDRYEEAIEALFNASKHESGGGSVCRALLLNLFNCYEFHFDVSQLSRLDESLYEYAMIAIESRYSPRRAVEPQHVIEDGSRRFQELAERQLERLKREEGPRP